MGRICDSHHTSNGEVGQHLLVSLSATSLPISNQHGDAPVCKCCDAQEQCYKGRNFTHDSAPKLCLAISLYYFETLLHLYSVLLTALYRVSQKNLPLPLRFSGNISPTTENFNPATARSYLSNVAEFYSIISNFVKVMPYFLVSVII